MSPKVEVKHIRAVADILGMKSCTSDLAKADDLKHCLCGKGGKWDCVYIAAHANTEGFGEDEGEPFIRWYDLAVAICETKCLGNNAVLLLACCNGGMLRVAATLFSNCTQIDYVCGPRWSVTQADLAAAFHVLLYNLEYRNEEPAVAVDRASKAVGYQFSFHDRIEWEDTYIGLYPQGPLEIDQTNSPQDDTGESESN
jgi:hypothetical protein